MTSWRLPIFSSALWGLDPSAADSPLTRLTRRMRPGQGCRREIFHTMANEDARRRQTALRLRHACIFVLAWTKVKKKSTVKIWIGIAN